MSITLDPVDLDGKVTGDNGRISVNIPATNWDIAGHYGEPATIRVLNESCNGLKIWTDTNELNEYLAAGGWVTWSINKGTNYVNWQVIYTMPNPAMDILLVTFFSPGEKVSDMPTLGNSPIAGSSSTTAVGNSLSNEGNSVPTKIVDIGQVANPNIIQIFSDGSFIWNILQGGTLHLMARGWTTGHALQLGQAGDVVEVLGNMQVDGLTSAPGGLLSTGLTVNSAVATFNAGVTVNGNETVTGVVTANTVHVQTLQLQTHTISDVTGGTVAVGASSVVTVTHGLASTPIVLICNEDASNTSTGAVRNRNSTTFQIFSFSACTWRWFAYF